MASDDPVTGRCGQAAATGRYGQGELRGGVGRNCPIAATRRSRSWENVRKNVTAVAEVIIILRHPT